MAASIGVGVVLRVWNLGGPGLSFDESFTAAYAALPLREIPRALAANDNHPPLDYLIRHLLVGFHSELLLRAPSAVFAIGALFGVAWLVRRRGWLGVGAVALSAVSAFALLYGREARMYSLMMLLGVVAAVAADRWLDEGGDRWCWTAGGALLLAAFTNLGAIPYACGLVLVPGFRRDRGAWRWRAGIVAPMTVWLVVWGPMLLEQSRRGGPSWVAFTSLRGLDQTVHCMVNISAGGPWLVSALVLAGGAALWRLDRRLGLLWVELFLVPLAVVALLGLRFRVLLPRTLSMSAWAVPVGLAALVVLVFRQRRSLGVVAAAVIVALSLRSFGDAIRADEGNREVMQAVVPALHHGDLLVIHPSWLWPLTWWNLGASRVSEVPSSVGLADVHGTVWGGGPFDGRVWVVHPASYAVDPVGVSPCPGVPARALSSQWQLDCFVVPPS